MAGCCNKKGLALRPWMNELQWQWWQWGPESSTKLKSVLRQKCLSLVSGCRQQMAIRSHQVLWDFNFGGRIKHGDICSLDGFPSLLSICVVGSFMCLAFAYVLQDFRLECLILPFSTQKTPICLSRLTSKGFSSLPSRSCCWLWYYVLVILTCMCVHMSH